MFIDTLTCSVAIAGKMLWYLRNKTRPKAGVLATIIDFRVVTVPLLYHSVMSKRPSGVPVSDPKQVSQQNRAGLTKISGQGKRNNKLL